MADVLEAIAAGMSTPALATFNSGERAMLPTGTVTMLFTDIEGSTRLLTALGDSYAAVLDAHRAILRRAIAENNGHEIDNQGDAMFCVFGRASHAVAAAVAAQRGLSDHTWPGASEVKVRMGLHTGEPLLTANGYVGLDVHRAARICAAGHGGQVLMSRSTAALAQDRLSGGLSLRDLGLHRLKDFDRPEPLVQLVAIDLPADFPPPRTLDTRPNNLPETTASLIGRESDAQEARRLLSRPEVRLLTFTGPGGVGKTRLALHVAAESLDDFTDGVAFVALGQVQDAALVKGVIARALNVGEREGSDLEDRLKEWLRERRMLLVLDNFEQVMEAAPLVGELLRSAAGVKCLVTSRAPLHLSGEREFSVLPLAVARSSAANGSMPERSPAVRLFVERAAELRPEWTPTAEEEETIAAICRRLDGLPLAIELAAARMRLLSPQALLARLDHGLDLLTTGARDLPARQRTLRGAIAWSYDLLGEDERSTFARMAVFAGGCTVEAAEQVAGPLDVLDGLVNHSLIRRRVSESGETRLSLLETVREFALERLETGDEADKARDAHAAYFLHLAETAEPLLLGRDQVRWMEALDRERANCRVALQWYHSRGDGVQGLRLAAALSRFWNVRGSLSEGRDWLVKMLELGAGQPSTDPREHRITRARALTRAAAAARRQGDYDQAREWLNQSAAAWRAIGDGRGLAYALQGLGQIDLHRGDMAGARANLSRSSELLQEAGDVWGLTGTLGSLGDVELTEGRIIVARSLYEQELRLARRGGFPGRVARALSDRGELARLQGDDDLAARSYRESLALSEENGDQLGIAGVEHNLGHVALHRHNTNRASAHFRRALSLFHLLGDRRGIAACMAGFAGVSLQRGNLRLAAQAFGFSEMMLESMHVQLPPADRAEWTRNSTRVRSMLDAPDFRSAWEEGRAADFDEAINLAMRMSVE